MSPFPEEINRKLISHLADIHFVQLNKLKNLNTEGIEKNVYTVGNTIVDSFELISSKNLETNAIKELVKVVEIIYYAHFIGEKIEIKSILFGSIKHSK